VALEQRKGKPDSLQFHVCRRNIKAAATLAASGARCSPAFAITPKFAKKPRTYAQIIVNKPETISARRRVFRFSTACRNRHPELHSADPPDADRLTCVLLRKGNTELRKSTAQHVPSSATAGVDYRYRQTRVVTDGRCCASVWQSTVETDVMTAPSDRQLIETAKHARKHAYGPYSGFRVGCAVLDETDRLHIGCNVENETYPEGTCAEAGAIAAMVVAGGRQIRAIAIAGGYDDLATCTPCGGCRQKIVEFSDDATRVLLIDASGAWAEHRIDALLPESFRLPG
jgi:cytidine deaminase